MNRKDSWRTFHNRVDSPESSELKISANSQVWENIFNNSPMSGMINFKIIGELRSRWSDIATEALAGHSMPWQIKGSTLVVAVDHSIFAQEISLLSNRLLKKINENTGHSFRKLQTIIRKISFTATSETGNDPMNGEERDIIPGRNTSSMTNEENEILMILRQKDPQE